MKHMPAWYAVAAKDIRSEVRSRYAFTAVALFVVTSVALVAFATVDEAMSKGVYAGTLWVVMFFTALTGLARGFVSEEERGTAFYLRTASLPHAVYWGKLAGNIVTSVVSNFGVTALFITLLTVNTSANLASLVGTVVVGSIGLAVVITITSAIVAKAGAKMALLPVLSFPMLLPVIMPGVGATVSALSGASVDVIYNDWLLMFSHSGLVVVLSWFVFETIWCD